MHSRNRNNHTKSKSKDTHCFNTPIECIRKTRSLNIDKASNNVSHEVYKILKSNNGRKIFSPCHGRQW